MKRLQMLSLMCFASLTLHCIPQVFAQSNSGFKTVPPLRAFSFQSLESKVIPGNSTEQAVGFNCGSPLNAADKIGSLALLSIFSQNGCYTDGQYNHRNFPVQRGVLKDASGLTSFMAYMISEPTKKAAQFLASEHIVHFQFPTAEAYVVCSFDSASKVIRKVADVPAAQVNTNQFIKIPALNASSIKGSVTYVFIPARLSYSVFTSLATGIEGATIRNDTFANVRKFRYTISGQIFDTTSGYTSGPGSWENQYGVNRQFYVVAKPTGELGAVWQDKTSQSIKVTWIGASSYISPALKNSRSEILAAATSDASGNLYYLTIQDGNGAPSTSRKVTLYKAKSDGTAITSVILDGTAASLDMLEFFKSACLRYANGTLGLLLGRQMHNGHQGGIAVVFDAATLRILKHQGQTSSHSFGNVLTVNSQTEFVGIDLGDNYPRGINLHRFTKTTRQSTMVYTFKTQHATTAAGPGKKTFPKYDEISTSSKSYYKWSNDNNTYTELGGIAEHTSGYSIVFAGEPDSLKKSINNTRVGNLVNDARNIGLVKVVRSFKNTGGNTVLDANILTTGLTETGGFYTFGGDWSAQRNKGVVWLTSYSNSAVANASRVKAVSIGENRILVLWESWTPTSYINTHAVIVDSLGKIIIPAVALGAHVRLGRTDDPFVIGKTVYIASGNRLENKLELIEIATK